MTIDEVGKALRVGEALVLERTNTGRWRAIITKREENYSPRQIIDKQFIGEYSMSPERAIMYVFNQLSVYLEETHG